MERVSSSQEDRPCSPCYSSDNDWEATSDHHSDTDADHSDSSDDDNPTSQVDRMINNGASMLMDGEVSDLSEDDTDDEDELSTDSESDITDVSPLVSNAASPLGLSPVMSRRNLFATSRAPFSRHYSHRGHDGDDEADALHDIPAEFDAKSPKMSFVVQELLKLTMNQKKSPVEDEQGEQLLLQQSSNRRRRSYKHELSPSLSANPHHRHLRRGSRKNLSFSNEEVRVINRDNAVLLEKLMAVNGREEPCHSPVKAARPANATVNRRKQEEAIRRDNMALLRRLDEARPSRGHHHAPHHHSNHHGSHHHHSSSHSPSTNHHSSHHNHHSANHNHHSSHHSSHHASSHHPRYHHTRPHHHHHTAARSCGVAANRHHTTSAFLPSSPFSPTHHAPKETAM